jgi:hypothetical protein
MSHVRLSRTLKKLFGFSRRCVIIIDALRSEPVFLTIIHAKRIRPAASRRVSAFVVLTGNGSMWLDPPGSFG